MNHSLWIWIYSVLKLVSSNFFVRAWVVSWWVVYFMYFGNFFFLHIAIASECLRCLLSFYSSFHFIPFCFISFSRLSCLSSIFWFCGKFGNVARLEEAISLLSTHQMCLPNSDTWFCSCTKIENAYILSTQYTSYSLSRYI